MPTDDPRSMTLDEIFDTIRDAVTELRALSEQELRQLAANRDVPLPDTHDTDELAFWMANWALEASSPEEDQS